MEGIFLSRMLFAKINFNGEIYNIYDNEKLFSELITEMALKINSDDIIIDDEKNVKFSSIIKENINGDEIIKGRIVAFYAGSEISYDLKEDRIVAKPNPTKAQYSTFYFNVDKQLIGFVPVAGFSEKQFIHRLELLIKECSGIDVIIILETDIALLRHKLTKLTEPKKIHAKIIPPNGDKDLFEELLDIESQELKETNVKQIDISLSSRKQVLNIGTSLINKFIKAAELGYALFSAEGKDIEGQPYKIKSNEDALFEKQLSSDSRDSIPDVEYLAKEGINELLLQKSERNR